VIHDGMLYDPIKGQVHGGRRVVKMAYLKVLSPLWYACNQKTNGEL